MSVRVETPHGVLRLLGDRCYLEVPGCPHGKLELLDGRQLRGELSVNHGAVCGCGYHETHDFEAAVRECALSLQQYARIKGIRKRAGVDSPPPGPLPHAAGATGAQERADDE